MEERYIYTTTNCIQISCNNHNLGRVPGYIEENLCFCTFSCEEKKLNTDKNNPPWG